MAQSSIKIARRTSETFQALRGKYDLPNTQCVLDEILRRHEPEAYKLGVDNENSHEEFLKKMKELERLND
jgi:hypothetical protein